MSIKSTRDAYRAIWRSARKNGWTHKFVGNMGVDRLAERALTAERIHGMAELTRLPDWSWYRPGQTVPCIAIVTSGMDCDGARWDNAVHIVPAIPSMVDQWLDSYYTGAEGPQSHYFARPSATRALKRTTRDLAMEAHENGHDHVLYY